MKKFTILVDVDGICADTLPSWLLRIYELTGVMVHPSDIKDWNLMANPALKDLDPDLVFGILNEPGFTLGLNTIGNTEVHLRALHEAGHKIYFVTARYGTVCMPETLAWFRTKFPWVDPVKQVVFMNDKHLVKGDILIDDKASTLRQYRQEHPNSHLIAIAYPYNMEDISNVHRVAYDDFAWNKIRDHINFLSMVSNESIH